MVAGTENRGLSPIIQKTPTKERITIRLSREVVERFRESGEGWLPASMLLYASGLKIILRLLTSLI